MGNHIIVRGMNRDVGFPVRTWEHTEWRFHGRNRTETRIVCAHWTGAENSVRTMYENMMGDSALGQSSPLSVHFAVDAKGNVYQLADTELRAAHCRAHDMNSCSIGIEFVSRGTSATASAKGVHRLRVSDWIHGERVAYWDLLPIQIEVGVRLIERLCDIYDLPLRVPEDALGNVASTELPTEILKNFRGVIGHLHAESRKYDPGMRLLRAVQTRARERKNLVG